jgi:hypothetical protein
VKQYLFWFSIFLIINYLEHIFICWRDIYYFLLCGVPIMFLASFCLFLAHFCNEVFILVLVFLNTSSCILMSKYALVT